MSFPSHSLALEGDGASASLAADFAFPDFEASGCGPAPVRARDVLASRGLLGVAHGMQVARP